MPTPSEPALADASANSASTWNASPAASRRSVFPNYRTAVAHSSSAPALAPAPTSPQIAGQTLQFSIDVAVARCFIHQFLARAWQDPAPETWSWLTDRETLAALWPAVTSVASSLLPVTQVLIDRLANDSFDSFHLAYLSAFGHAARGPHALNEIEYGDLKADPLFQPHRLADLAAFYRAFGMEIAPDAGERHDHLCLELEFLCFLAAREAYALEHQLEPEDLAISRDAQKKFLREHLGRWVPACMRRLARELAPGALQSLAQFTRTFIETDCARFGVPGGSEDLLLRPVDSSAESLCASCGLSSLPPGALAETGTGTYT